MTRRLLLLAAVALAVLPGPVPGAPGAEGEDGDRYLRQTWRTRGIPASTAPLVAELRKEVASVLEAGPLAPMRTVYADLVQDEYFMYWQPGRIVTTLARAYPHLTRSQQGAVRAYVRAELDRPERAPWAPKGYLGAEDGARRELHGFHRGFGWDRYWSQIGRRKPIMGSFYGLWLYAHRTGDWDPLRRHYADLSALYDRRAGECDLYSTMGAHLAMARIAARFGDRDRAAKAAASARAAFAAGADVAAVEARTKSYWPERYTPRQLRGAYQGWMFLDLAPEVGRFLKDHAREPVLARHREALARFPNFWLREVPYNSRWTGDEGLGIPTELMGMLVPVDRWVNEAPAATLASYARSAPICKGDCYWIEMLVDAIEAAGTTTWVDLPEDLPRKGTPRARPTSPS